MYKSALKLQYAMGVFKNKMKIYKPAAAGTDSDTVSSGNALWETVEINSSVSDLIIFDDEGRAFWRKSFGSVRI